MLRARVPSSTFQKGTRGGGLGHGRSIPTVTSKPLTIIVKGWVSHRHNPAHGILLRLLTDVSSSNWITKLIGKHNVDTIFQL